uniref:Uncharacterized protein n=1 Tax=Oryza rufipogon TaxID=4529 RepID=A0A0E0NBY0_ORYRU
MTGGLHLFQRTILEGTVFNRSYNLTYEMTDEHQTNNPGRPWRTSHYSFDFPGLPGAVCQRDMKENGSQEPDVYNKKVNKPLSRMEQ